MLLLEHALDMPAVVDAGGEDQNGLPAPRELDDLGAGGLNQRVVVHQVLNLGRDKLPGSNVQLRRVDLDGAPLRNERGEVASDDDRRGHANSRQRTQAGRQPC